MVRIISPLGKLIQVYQAVPILEQIDEFNGKKQFRGEVCNSADGVEPNGVAIQHSGASTFGMSELIVGNLTSELVAEIMDSLLRLGYYDFSKLQYQNQLSMAKIKIGDSAMAYTSEITLVNSMNYCQKQFNPFARISDIRFVSTDNSDVMAEADQYYEEDEDSDDE